MKNTITYLKCWQNNGKKVAIYCAGRHGLLFSEILKRCGVRIDVFFDSSSVKWGEEIDDGVYCANPRQIVDKELYMVFICIDPRYYEQVRNTVCKAGYENIVDFNAVLDDVIMNHRRLYCNLIRQYQSIPAAEVFYTPFGRQKALWDGCGAARQAERIAVYTGIFGDYDELCEPAVIPPNVDYYFLSDVKPERESVFKWIDAKTVIPAEVTSPVKRNRYIKMHPHLLFPDYKYSVYIDGNIYVKGDITSFVRENPSGITVFMHPKRDCIFYEAVTIVNFQRVAAEDVCRQMEKYLDEGMPLHYGMPEMPVIAREHHKPACRRIMEDWWKEFDMGAQRDQLSFMYAVWKNGMTIRDISSLGSDVRKDKRLKFRDHSHENRRVFNDKICRTSEKTGYASD